MATGRFILAREALNDSDIYLSLPALSGRRHNSSRRLRLRWGMMIAASRLRCCQDALKQPGYVVSHRDTQHHDCVAIAQQPIIIVHAGASLAMRLSMSKARAGACCRSLDFSRHRQPSFACCHQAPHSTRLARAFPRRCASPAPSSASSPIAIDQQPRPPRASHSPSILDTGTKAP